MRNVTSDTNLARSMQSSHQSADLNRSMQSSAVKEPKREPSRKPIRVLGVEELVRTIRRTTDLAHKLDW